MQSRTRYRLDPDDNVAEACRMSGAVNRLVDEQDRDRVVRIVHLSYPPDHAVSVRDRVLLDEGEVGSHGTLRVVLLTAS